MLTGIGAGHAASDCTQGTNFTHKLSLSPNPVARNDVFTMTASIECLNFNAVYDVWFFRYIPSGTDVLEYSTQINSGAEGAATVTTPALSPPHAGTVQYYSVFTDGIDTYTSDLAVLTVLEVQASSALDAAPASRLNPTFRATLTAVAPATGSDGSPGGPLAGRSITFTVSGTTVCSAVTGNDGVASCHFVGLVLGPSTYTATFAGDQVFTGSSDTAPFVP